MEEARAALQAQLEAEMRKQQVQLEEGELPTPRDQASEMEHALAALNQEVVSTKLRSAELEAKLTRAEALLRESSQQVNACVGD